MSSSGFRPSFPGLFRIRRQVAHVLLTLSPLSPRREYVRLACLIHAASVHSEPGSNSPLRKVRTHPRRNALFFNNFSRGGDGVRAVPEGTRFVAVTDNSIHRDNRTIFRCSVAKELFLPQVRRSITLSELSTFASPARTFFGNSVWIKRKAFRPSYLL